MRAGLGPGLRSFAPSPPHAAPAWGSPRPGLLSEASRSAGGWKTDIGLGGAPPEEPEGHSTEGRGRVLGRQRQGSPFFPSTEGLAPPPATPSALPPTRPPGSPPPLSGKQTHPYLWARGSWPPSNNRTGGCKWLQAQQGREPTSPWPQGEASTGRVRAGEGPASLEGGREGRPPRERPQVPICKAG